MIPLVMYKRYLKIPHDHSKRKYSLILDIKDKKICSLYEDRCMFNWTHLIDIDRFWKLPPLVVLYANNQISRKFIESFYSEIDISKLNK